MESSGNNRPTGTIGIWQVSDQQVIDVNMKYKDKPFRFVKPRSFSYDGKYITMHLLPEKEWMWRAEDDYYKLKSKWIDSTLYWLPPFGKWTPLARYASGHFYEETERVTWQFFQVDEQQLADNEKLLLKERSPHDYQITPMWEKKPGW